MLFYCIVLYSAKSDNQAAFILTPAPFTCNSDIIYLFLHKTPQKNICMVQLISVTCMPEVAAPVSLLW